MTEEESKKAIREALEILRDDIENVRDKCAEKIMPLLKDFEINIYDENDVYFGIESLADIDSRSFFNPVGFEMMNMCVDISLCAEGENEE